MKRIFLLITICALTISCSKNDDDNLTEINNDGTGGISCLVDGKVLVSRGQGSGIVPEVFGFANDDDIYFFALRLSNRNSGFNNDKSMRIQVYDVEYLNPTTFERLSLEGMTYQLGTFGDPNSYGEFQTYGHYSDNSLELGEYYTTEIINGEITITFHDLENYVIAGTFWFDAVNENGEIIEIRDGRFDKVITGL